MGEVIDMFSRKKSDKEKKDTETDFAAIELENKKLKEAIAEKRKQSNKNVLKSYRLK